MSLLGRFLPSRASSVKRQTTENREASRSKVQFLKDTYPQHNIGEGSYGSLRVKSWGEGAKLTIGSYCSFADGVTILLGGEHRADWISTYPFSEILDNCPPAVGHPHTKGDVSIGSDVWIGTEALILSGVNIGHGAIIGARAVISKDVPSYAIVVGNPGKCIRKRFDDVVIQDLLDLRWWDWPSEKVRANIGLLQSGQVSMLFQDRA